ncbi:MAG: CRISPR-associated endonuclease Cas1 [Maritimibacter sp.]|nr:CRISPR-associated endonuclease Cas1 [Maritimibacter sp.]
MISLSWRRRPPPHPAPLEPHVPAPSTREDARLPLHIVADDAELGLARGRLVVQAGGSKMTFRLEEISLVGLHGGARATIPCLQALAREGVPVALFSRSGYLLGQIVDTTSSVSSTRRAQYAAAADAKTSLRLAKILVEGKLRGTARLARRRCGANAAVTNTLLRSLTSVARCDSAASLRGIEGAAAAAWYAAWPAFFDECGPLFRFDGRSRRPPRDAVNALLSYLYAVTAGTAAAAANLAGLDQNVGFYHAERPGRPALALDLVEPLRPVLVDTAVIAAIRNREFSHACFETQPEGGVSLSLDGRRRALGLIERRLSTVLSYDGADMTWRAAISRHAQLLARGLRDGRLDVSVPAPK